ncbi:hypothetical protein [Stutzerimonas tarimensis]|uniref:Cobalamin ABC transporter n=1 Tax=Stutzerimonas tarimensis TaxID=1507735 RepID=A0ABV7TAG8_9GAMM
MLNLSARSQLYIGLALAILMAMTRGSHFDAVNLPSASWAVFFLAGVLLQPRWAFPALFLLASVLDFIAVGWQGVGGYCMSPAYWMLIPAYGSLWLGGRLYSQLHFEHPASLAGLAGSAASSAFVCYLFSGGGYLYLSGRYPDPSLSQLGERIATYYPSHLGNLMLYVGIAAVLYAGLHAAALLRQDARA